MNFRVQLAGLEAARRRLLQAGRRLDPVVRGALNTTATRARKECYVAPMGGSLKAARIRKAIVIKRANSRRREAMLIPSSSGVPVMDYKSWGIEKITATRARIWVLGPDRKKVAAGFVNPSSRKKRPLSTRSSRARMPKSSRGNRFPHIKSYTYSHPLRDALGPSMAYWFKQMTDADTIQWVSTFLQGEFMRRVERDVFK